MEMTSAVLAEPAMDEADPSAALTDEQVAIRDAIAFEMKAVPTYVVGVDGKVRRIRKRRKAPDPVQFSLLEGPGFLTTGIVWGGLAIAARIEIMTGSGQSTRGATTKTILDVLPPASRLWLRGWQMQVNTGSCWHTAGSIGRQADALIEAGYLLRAKAEGKDYFGNHIASRDEAPAGSPGTPLYVQAIMGAPYLAWIAGIE